MISSRFCAWLAPCCSGVSRSEMVRIEPARQRLFIRTTPVALALVVSAASSFAQEPQVGPPPSAAVDSSETGRGAPLRPEPQGGKPKPVATDEQMRHKYLWSTLGFDGALGATLTSGFDQWKGSPPEWGTGA